MIPENTSMNRRPPSLSSFFTIAVEITRPPGNDARAKAAQCMEIVLRLLGSAKIEAQRAKLAAMVGDVDDQRTHIARARVYSGEAEAMLRDANCFAYEAQVAEGGL
jgi:hypothetical protein